MFQALLKLFKKSEEPIAPAPAAIPEQVKELKTPEPISEGWPFPTGTSPKPKTKKPKTAGTSKKQSTSAPPAKNTKQPANKSQKQKPGTPATRKKK